MKLILFLILVCYLLFILFNLVLKMRVSNHSNKFVKKTIQKLKLSKVLKAQSQGWAVTSFKTNKSILEFSNKMIPQQKWFQIKDKECSGVADPFLIKEKETYYLFFEYEYHKELNKGADLAYATSNDGLMWKYQQKIIEEPFHQSFPNIFKVDKEFYILPESYQSNQVRLYKVINFPNEWELDTVLFEGEQFVDTIFIEKEGVYYWMTTNLKTDTLELYYSGGLKEKWILHPSSPISNSLENNRNAGKIILENNTMYRVAQDGRKGYGAGVNLYEIIALTKTKYQEVLVKEKLFFKEEGRVKDALHHISILEDDNLMAVDGANFGINGVILNK